MAFPHRTTTSSSVYEDYIRPPISRESMPSPPTSDNLERDFHALATKVLVDTDPARSSHTSYTRSPSYIDDRRNAIYIPPVPDASRTMDSSSSGSTSPILGEWSGQLATQRTNISTEVSHEDKNNNDGVTSHTTTAAYRRCPHPQITPIINACTLDGRSIPMHLMPPERARVSTPHPSATSSAVMAPASSEMSHTPSHMGSSGEGMESAAVMRQGPQHGVVMESTQDRLRLRASTVRVVGFGRETRGDELERMDASVGVVTDGTLKGKSDESRTLAETRRTRLNTTIRPKVKTAMESRQPANSSGQISPMPQTPAPRIPPPKVVFTPVESGVGRNPTYLSPPEAPRKPRESPDKRGITPGDRSRARFGEARFE